MRKDILDKLKELRERGLYAANWLREKGWTDPVQDMVNYIIELEAQLSGADSEFFKEIAGQRGNSQGITIKKGKFEVNGKTVEGIKVEIGEDLNLDPTEIIKQVAAQLQKEHDEQAGGDEPDTEDESGKSDKTEDKGSEGATDGESTDTKKVGEPTIH